MTWNPALRALPRILAVALLAAFLTACATVPVTGRRQLVLVSNSDMMALSVQEYGKFLNEHTASKNAADTEMVRRAGARIQHAVEQYFQQQNMANRLGGYKWEFNLVEDKQVNAWCMPGGKVVVYTGILPVTGDETGLAVVLGHEIAHAVADHGAERMSQSMLAQLGGVALSEALASKPSETRALWMSAFGAGAQVGALLPFSRIQESEADHLGLIFMAMAGYDPNAAVAFWSRMASSKGGQGAPEFMSTHPSDQTRIQKIKAELPEALRCYRKPAA